MFGVWEAKRKIIDLNNFFGQFHPVCNKKLYLNFFQMGTNPQKSRKVIYNNNNYQNYVITEEMYAQV